MAATPDSYSAYLAGKNLSPSAVKNRMRGRLRYFDWCAGAGVDPLTATADDVGRYLQHLRSLDLRQSSARLYMLGLRSFYKYLAETAKHPDPTASVRVPHQNARDVQPFTPQEIQQLRGVCLTALDTSLFFLFVGTGMRNSEVAKLREWDINWHEGTIQVLGKGRDGGKRRTVAPPPVVMAALRQYFDAPGDWGVKLVPHDFVSRWLKRKAKEAGLTGRIHAHRMRYTFAVEFCEAGNGIDQLQVLLGHSNISMSLFYAKKGKERRAQEANRRFDLGARYGLTA